MEFLRSNLYDTTTSIVVNSNTDTAQYLMDPDRTFQYVSSGFNNDLTTVSIRINFAATTSVSRIALVNHNIKDYTIFYNGATANTFALTTSGSTISSAFTSNSETSQYLTATPVDCTSVTFDLKKTITTNAEKAIGYLVLSNVHLTMSRIPSAQDYEIKIIPTDVVHKLSDGGVRIQTVADKHMINVGLEYISETLRNSLRSFYNMHEEFIFAPFETTTSWDAIIFPAVWEGSFDFYKFSDNAASAGFSGKINIKEAPR